MSRTFASNEFELLSPASSFAILVWWPFHLNYYESNEKELLAAGLTFWWEVVQAGTFSGSREATEVEARLEGWRVFGWLDGWMVGWLSPVVTDWEYNYLEKYDRNPLWHWVRVGKSMMVVEDHDGADNATRNLEAEAVRSVQSAGKQALNLDLSQ